MDTERQSRWLDWLISILLLPLAVVLVWAVLTLPEPPPGLSAAVRERLLETGVQSPVTAVLLNFRAYDTMLEIGVLLLAVLACLALRRGHPPGPVLMIAPAGPVLAALTHLLVPLMVLVAGYLLWAGEHAPGGAFQAGAVLGAAGVLLLLGEKIRPAEVPEWLLRVLLAVGFCIFLAVAAALLLLRGQLLEFPPAWAGGLIVLLETVLTISIGATLVALFAANPPAHSPLPDHWRQERRRGGGS
jgi:multisubunit Na+/H+ antiporter MnhB subunit